MLFSCRLFLCLIMALICTMCTTNPVSEKDTIKEFWFWYPELREYAEQRMEQEKSKLHTVQDVKRLQNSFRTIQEIEDFEPTIEIVFARELVGNCKSAAALGKWSLEQIGIESSFYNLSGNGVPSHRVCVSEDKHIMITNNILRNLTAELWQTEVLLLFSHVPYTRIQKEY